MSKKRKINQVFLQAPSLIFAKNENNLHRGTMGAKVSYVAEAHGVRVFEEGKTNTCLIPWTNIKNTVETEIED